MVKELPNVLSSGFVPNQLISGPETETNISTATTSRGAGGTTSLAGRFMVLLPPPLVTGCIEEYDGYDGESDAERTRG